jgi:hypothetical protein
MLKEFSTKAIHQKTNFYNTFRNHFDIFSVCMLLAADLSGRACFCDRSLVVTVGSNPAVDMYVCLLLSVVWCQVEVFATG